MNWFAKKTVVSPVDFSDESMAAIDVALDVVNDPRGLHVLHVLPVFIPIAPTVDWEMWHGRARSEAVEDILRKRLSAKKYRGLLVRVAVGDPGQQIVRYAKRVKAEMIVLPSHGRTGIKRLLIGSVAERVCRLAHCPVLVLRS